jgi:hypothetical protein
MSDLGNSTHIHFPTETLIYNKRIKAGSLIIKYNDGEETIRQTYKDNI